MPLIPWGCLLYKLVHPDKPNTQFSVENITEFNWNPWVLELLDPWILDVLNSGGSFTIFTIERLIIPRS